MKKEEILLTAIFTAEDDFESTWKQEKLRYVYNTKNQIYAEYNKRIYFTILEKKQIIPSNFYRNVFKEVSNFYLTKISLYVDATLIHEFYLLRFSVDGKNVYLPALKKDETISFDAIDWSIAHFLSENTAFLDATYKLFTSL